MSVTEDLDQKRLTDDRRSRATVFRAAAGLASLALMSALVVTTSRAAFSRTTDNSSNSFTSGNVDLTDDDSNTARFSDTLELGETVTHCIEVTYSGTSDPSPVKFYSGGFTDTSNLADHLNVTIDEGNGGDFSTCVGFTEDDAGAEFAGTLTAFDALTGYGVSAGDWDPTAGGQSKTYRIAVELDAATPSAEQGQDVTGLTFTWEVQS
jgi:hypothetical protein